MSSPPLPAGFTDQAAWDAIHFSFSGNGTLLDQAVIAWQLDNQERVDAASKAAAEVEDRLGAAVATDIITVQDAIRGTMNDIGFALAEKNIPRVPTWTMAYARLLAAEPALDRLVVELRKAEGRLTMLGAHEFIGRADQWCLRCNKPDRHPIHSAMMVRVT